MIRRSLLRKFTGVRLSDEESRIFASFLEASDGMGKGTVLRAAGGWVRDKILGIESHDIDIALDNVPGDEFARYVHDREHNSGKISSIGVVKENPDQSKHIRTATFRFHGFDIDMNNLRSETYTQDSRIPEVQFAKHPSEDALRRDFTINALYYNINTREIEDFTGSGLSDLEQGIIRTPLPAARTFVDDPLRALRAIRFAARLGFALHEDILKAWTRDDVRVGLLNKVSRERVGIEVTKMMKDENRFEAVSLLHRSGLLKLLLEPPEDQGAPSLSGVSARDYSEWKAATILVNEAESDDINFDEILTRLESLDIVSLSEEKKTLLSYCILFLGAFRGRKTPSPSVVARLSMKLPSTDSKAIGSVLSSLKPLDGLLNDFSAGALVGENAAIAFGRIIRGPLQEMFPCALRLATAHLEEDLGRDLLRKVESLLDEFSLRDCHKWKPVVDGSELCRVFSIKPGPIIQKLLSVEFDLMFKGERDRDTLIAAMQLKLGEQ